MINLISIKVNGKILIEITLLSLVPALMVVYGMAAIVYGYDLLQAQIQLHPEVMHAQITTSFSILSKSMLILYTGIVSILLTVPPNLPWSYHQCICIPAQRKEQ